MNSNTPKPYETQDARAKGLVISGVVLLVLVAASVAAMAVLFGFFEEGRKEAMTAVDPMSEFREAPAGPILQVDPPRELSTLQSTTRDTLLGYGWVDTVSDRVRIPVDRAMDVLVERNRGKR